MKKLNLSFLYMACLLLVGVFVAAVPRPEEGYKVGDKARDFKLKGTDGKTMSLSDFKNAKGIIVTFTCNSCPYAVAYEDRLIELNNKYAPLGYPVVAINSNDVVKSPEDSFDKMKVRASGKKFTFPYLYDESQEIIKAYGATRTPQLYVVQKQKDNSFKVAYIGAIDDNHRDASKVEKKYAEAALDELVQGKPVTQNTTKAIGCTIKWRAEAQ